MPTQFWLGAPDAFAVVCALEDGELFWGGVFEEWAELGEGGELEVLDALLTELVTILLAGLTGAPRPFNVASTC